MRILFLVFVFLVVAAFPVRGAGVDLSDLSLDELFQVEITGSTLTPESLKTVPSAVSLFSHEEIERLGLDSLDELMNLVPGFQSYRSSTSSQHRLMSARGRRIGVASSEVLVMVDGQRIEEPRNSGSVAFLGMIPLSQIERVEFIRGPGAAIYGSNAMMGVVNIITRSDVNELSVGIGGLGRREISALLSQEIGDVKVDFFARLDRDDGANYSAENTFGTGRVNTTDPREHFNANARIRWRDTDINIQHYHFNVEDFYELNRISNGFNEQDGRLSSLSLKQSFSWQSMDSWIRMSYADTRVDISAQLGAAGVLSGASVPDSDDAWFVIADFTNYSETRAQWHNSWEIDAQSSLQFGVELRHIDAPTTIAQNNFDLGDFARGNFPVRYYGSLKATTPVQMKSKRDITGLYAQYQRDLRDTTHLTLGLRYDDFSSIGSQLSPRVGVVHEVDKHNSVKLLYGEAFRAPAENELNLANNPIVTGNPSLKPESTQSLDLVWVGQWKYSGFSFGYFESHFKDAFVLTTLGTGLQQFQNAKQDLVKGFEFELSQELSTNWLLRGTFTKITERPDFSYRESDNLASLIVNYNSGKWNANVSAVRVGTRKMPTGGSEFNRIRLDGYWYVAGKVSYEITETAQLFLKAKNLFDERYLTPTTAANLNEGVPNRGREIMLGTTIEW